jgi:multicomponent Na+:H+ antiporter subunit A
MTTIGLASQAPGVVDGAGPGASYRWAPSAGATLLLEIDALSFMLALLVAGVGALVLAYSARYFGSSERQAASTCALLTAFAVAMLGLVFAADVVSLFIFWEITSVISFFLIGGDGGPGRTAALRALLVTGLGGLALFAGLIICASLAGSTSLSAIFLAAEPIRSSGLAPWIAGLLMLGAFTKSAQVPFHFWLPGAMVAPTPVSTYLHAATMVKAGIYLVARFAPLFAGWPLWTYTIVLVGLATSVYAGLIALKQYDLKALLAYSTVSQLGWIIALTGAGTFRSLLAAGTQIGAHGLYKATLFMVVGVVEKKAGTRDLRRLSGLYRAMPWTAVVALIASMSLLGLPPLLGFVGKEESLAAFLELSGASWLVPLAGALALLASVFTVAYGLRLLFGTFGGAAGPGSTREAPASLLAAPAVAALGGLVAVLALDRLDLLAGTLAAELSGRPEAQHLALWHGVEAPLVVSAIALAGGSALHLARAWVAGALALRVLPSGAAMFDALYRWTEQLGHRLGEPFVTPVLGRHLAWVLAAALGFGGVALSLGRAADLPPPPWRTTDLWALCLLTIACAGVVTARDRLAAVSFLGLAGFTLAVMYALFGAPDLVLTQLLIETLTVALVVLVFRHVPRRFSPEARLRRSAALAAALASGVAAALGTYAVMGRRPPSDAARYFLRAAEAEAGGKNVVNTILVDFRALDTLGEITVLLVAAVGVYLLVKATGGARR